MQPIETTRAHCVDPETLAAWVDGGLAAPAAEAVEAHLSTCARCQAVLAALSATEIVLPFWSRRPVQWAAATLAAAASITLWTMNRPIEPAPMPTLTPESVTVQAPPAPTPSTPPTPSASAPSELRRTSPAPSVAAAPPPASLIPEPAPVLAPPVLATPPPPSPPPPPPAPTLPPPPPAAAPPPVNPGMAATAARQQQRALSAAAEVAAPRPTFEVISVSDQNEPLAMDGLVPTGAGRGGGGRGTAGNVAAGFTRRPQARWRVSATSVERSLDSGQTWERLDVDPPFIVTAGSAPFQNVCWLVGHDGVVFRTTNGTSFERMSPPDKVDLLAIVASDRLRAMVTAVDGRIFETTDGGVSWIVRK